MMEDIFRNKELIICSMKFFKNMWEQYLQYMKSIFGIKPFVNYEVWLIRIAVYVFFLHGKTITTKIYTA